MGAASVSGLFDPPASSSSSGGGGGISIGSLIHAGLDTVGTIFGGLQQGVLHGVESFNEFSDGNIRGGVSELARAGLIGSFGGLGAMVGGAPGAVLGGSAGNMLGNAIAGDDTLDAQQTLGVPLDSGWLGKAENFGLNVATDPAILLSGGTSAAGDVSKGAGLLEKASAEGIGVGLPGLPKLSLASGDTLLSQGDKIRGALTSADDAVAGGRFADLMDTTKSAVSNTFSADARRMTAAGQAGFGNDASALNDAIKDVRTQGRAVTQTTMDDFTRNSQAFANVDGVLPADRAGLLRQVEEGTAQSKTGQLLMTASSENTPGGVFQPGALPGVPTKEGARLLRSNPDILSQMASTDPGAADAAGMTVTKPAYTEFADEAGNPGAFHPETTVAGPSPLPVDPNAPIGAPVSRQSISDALKTGRGFPLPTATTADANSAIADLIGKPGFKTFQEDPFVSARASMANAASIAGSDASEQGIAQMIADGKITEPQADFMRDQLKAGGSYLPDPGGLMGKWRSLATSMPSFQVRNQLAHLMKVIPEGTGATELASQNSIQSVLRGLSDEDIVANGGVEGAAKAAMSPEQFDMWTQERKAGVLQGSMARNDLPGGGVTLPGDESAARRVVSAPGRALHTFGNESQDTLRGATYQAQLNAGKDSAGAVRETNRILIDYSDTTPAVKGLRSTIMPFATFSAKNTPVALGQALKSPALAALPLHVKEQLSNGWDIPETSIEAAGKTLSPIASLSPGFGGQGQGGNLRLAGLLGLDQVGGPFADLQVGSAQSTASASNLDMLSRAFPLTAPLTTAINPGTSLASRAAKIGLGVKPDPAMAHPGRPGAGQSVNQNSLVQNISSLYGAASDLAQNVPSAGTTPAAKKSSKTQGTSRNGLLAAALRTGGS